MKIENEITFLVTTVALDETSIISLVSSMNLFDNVIVGNQKCLNNSIHEYNFPSFHLTIVNQSSSGTSKNRNFIFSLCKTKFVSFLDDDSILIKDCDVCIKRELKKVKDKDVALRFNCVSLNQRRPIAQIKKCKYLKFNEVKSYGVWGCIYQTDFLKKMKLIFNEKIGPGTKINHGEDTYFNFCYLKKGRIFQIDNIMLSLSQESSTWHESDYFYNAYCHGYLYGLIYGRLGLVFLLFHLIKHKKDCCYPSIFKMFKSGKKGYKQYKEG